MKYFLFHFSIVPFILLYVAKFENQYVSKNQFISTKYTTLNFEQDTTIDSAGVLIRDLDSLSENKEFNYPENNKIFFNICIDRNGSIIYFSLNKKMSKINDENFARDSEKLARNCKFKSNPLAFKKECGILGIDHLGKVKRY